MPTTQQRDLVKTTNKSHCLSFQVSLCLHTVTIENITSNELHAQGFSSLNGGHVA